MNLPLLDRVITKARVHMQGRLECYEMVASLVKDKSGIEIGGPSEVFRKPNIYLPIYSCAKNVDNCDFSSNTTWAQHSEAFHFDAKKSPGKNIFADGSDLRAVPDHSYDFLLSSHNLEHFANPVKALKEWQRITVSEGVFVLVLPDSRYTFDRRRQPTTVDHLLEDYERNTLESDLTHLPEILEKHDLDLDRAAGTREEFHKRSLANFENRCLHHHVFNETNLDELLTNLGMKVLALETAWPFHIFAIAQKIVK
jgi:SAM-dependent methyltransferase